MSYDPSVILPDSYPRIELPRLVSTGAHGQISGIHEHGCLKDYFHLQLKFSIQFSSAFNLSMQVSSYSVIGNNCDFIHERNHNILHYIRVVAKSEMSHTLITTLKLQQLLGPLLDSMWSHLPVYRHSCNLNCPTIWQLSFSIPSTTKS